MKWSTVVLVGSFFILQNTLAWVDPFDETPAKPEYAFDFKYGQKILFSSGAHLQQFIADPPSAFGSVEEGTEESMESSMKDGKDGGTATSNNATKDHDHHHDFSHIDGSCPVCAMAVSKSSFHVNMIHGDQKIYACSKNHAHQVFSSALAFAAEKYPLPGGKICRGKGTVMFNGFQTVADSGECVLLWFTSWTLDTRLKLYLGWMAVFFVALATEMLQAFRRKLRDVTRLSARHHHTSSETASLLRMERRKTMPQSFVFRLYKQLPLCCQHGIQSVLHGMTLCFAYLLMLAAMTYSISLFAFAILGFIVGYFIFADRYGDIPEYAEPCCS